MPYGVTVHFLYLPRRVEISPSELDPGKFLGDVCEGGAHAKYLVRRGVLLAINIPFRAPPISMTADMTRTLLG